MLLPSGYYASIRDVLQLLWTRYSNTQIQTHEFYHLWFPLCKMPQVSLKIALWTQHWNTLKVLAVHRWWFAVVYRLTSHHGLYLFVPRPLYQVANNLPQLKAIQRIIVESEFNCSINQNSWRNSWCQRVHTVWTKSAKKWHRVWTGVELHLYLVPPACSTYQ